MVDTALEYLVARHLNSSGSRTSLTGMRRILRTAHQIPDQGLPNGSRAR